mgnify:CR=1 FL=1
MNVLKDKHGDYRKLRQSMVDRQIVHRGVRAPLVLDAMRSVPREAFLPPDLREFAYDDSPLPIEEGQTISQPYIVALMVEALLLQGGETVLEIGAGSGYAAAVIAKIPMGRLGRPDEVAHLVNWLASEECSFSTGAVFDISGGRATY